jgi:adenine-specific DNA-methyltransferase
MGLELKTIPPKKALNKAFLKYRPSRNEINLFKENIRSLRGKIDEDAREENQKNHIRDFLLDTYYKNSYEINVYKHNDLVIHNGPSRNDSIGVLIEAKRPNNKYEMISKENPNVKAMHELILYYLRERIDNKNNNIKYCIATNIYEWYIIDSSYFERYFYRNKSLVKEYKQWRDGLKVTKDTSLFYNEIVKSYVENIDESILCTYFDLRNYENVITNGTSEIDKELISLYKILSPHHLLKETIVPDSNTLNEKFYKELLHIVGLEENKTGNKLVITRKDKSQRNNGSLIENTINLLETENTIYNIPNLKYYGDNKAEQLFNIALELCITWVNRILFLKLLEGQLLKYHLGDNNYRFLNIEIINDYNELYKLFHQVLAIIPNKRNQTIKNKYRYVPYLNSSLFEVSDLENLTVKVNSLDDTLKIPLFKSTVLIDVREKSGSLPTLEYIFRFLDSYDFASEGKEEIQEDENKTLINASVLGKVFEKINGYKDGSIFTPGVVTMYMCRQAIRAVIVQKFKDKYGWNIETFDDIKNYIYDRRSGKEILEFNQVINSLRICDIAVGSGHYLVSALNEIITIKSELGILADKKGSRITDYEVAVENDELIVTESDTGEIFTYNIKEERYISPKVQRIQKILFDEKQTIIENCLFGVDINPKSVLICRLRLWIELLKNSYYKEPEYKELETLPNIDINIKCGNSLLSRFPIDADLSKALKSIKYNIEHYKSIVQEYKNAKNIEVKKGLEKIIDDIKKDFRSEILKNDPKVIKMNEKTGELYNLLNQTKLFELNNKQKNILIKRKKKLEEDINKLKKEIDEIKTNELYKNAFEWRFEFPEVLNDNGEYEGFDLIISNPPYIESRSSAIHKKMKDELQKIIEYRRWSDAKFIKRGADILIYFYEAGLYLVKDNGALSFITQNSWLDTDYGFKFQKFLMRNTKIVGIYDNDKKYFEESANINTIITFFRGKRGSKHNNVNFVRFNVDFENAPYETRDIEALDSNSGNIVSIPQSDEILKSIKWGILINSDSVIIDLHKRLLEAKSANINNYIVGQGLNLSKDYVVNENIINKLNIPLSQLISFMTNDDGAPFIIHATHNYLINGDMLTKRQREKLSGEGIKIPIINKNTRKVPNLILPRGVGRYFCAINRCSTYSSSFVEIYLYENDEIHNYEKYIWLFLNSSVGWLIREISGRKNLGGGMLKAEAIDLKQYPLHFEFESELQEINKLIKTLSKREAYDVLNELESREHKLIDDIVFNKLNIPNKERYKIKNKLKDLIERRIKKARRKK